MIQLYSGKESIQEVSGGRNGSDQGLTNLWVSPLNAGFSLEKQSISRNRNFFFLFYFSQLLMSINIPSLAQTCMFLRTPKAGITAHFTIQLPMFEWKTPLREAATPSD